MKLDYLYQVLIKEPLPNYIRMRQILESSQKTRDLPIGLGFISVLSLVKSSNMRKT